MTFIFFLIMSIFINPTNVYNSVKFIQSCIKWNGMLLLPYHNTLWFVISSEVFHFLELLVSTIFLQTMVQHDLYIFILLSFFPLLWCVINTLDEHCRVLPAQSVTSTRRLKRGRREDLGNKFGDKPETVFSFQMKTYFL